MQSSGLALPNSICTSALGRSLEWIMSEGSSELAFDVVSPLGFRVRVTKRYWSFIVSVKHPAMLGREDEVCAALTAPNEIRQSRFDSEVYLFYSAIAESRWVCAVAKRQSPQDGFLITAYPTDAIKEGDRIWPK